MFENPLVDRKMTSRGNRVVGGMHNGSTTSRAAITPIPLARGRDDSRKGKQNMAIYFPKLSQQSVLSPTPTSSCDFSKTRDMITLPLRATRAREYHVGEKRPHQIVRECHISQSSVTSHTPHTHNAGRHGAERLELEMGMAGPRCARTRMMGYDEV